MGKMLDRGKKKSDLFWTSEICDAFYVQTFMTIYKAE